MGKIATRVDKQPGNTRRILRLLEMDVKTVLICFYLDRASDEHARAPDLYLQQLSNFAVTREAPTVDGPLSCRLLS